MATGNRGTISVTGTKQMSAILYWSETYDVSSNTHVVSIDNISQSNNAIYNASFSTSNVKANPAHIVVYQGALSVGTSTSYPTYSNGAFNLNKQLKAGWTYNYMVAYG